MWNLKRSKKRTRADTYKAYYLSDREDILPGYTRISDNEEVRQCANKIADLVSSMTIMLMQNGEKGDFRLKNSLSRVVDIEPSYIMTRKTFVHRIVLDMLLTGNAVAVPEFSGRELKSQTLLKAEGLTFKENNNGYEIKSNGAVFQHDEVLHFPLVPDDDYPFKGVGYVNQIKNTVENLVQAQCTKTSFLRSKWKPPLIISVSADGSFLQDPKERKKLLGSYRDDTEQGEPWIIPAGEIDVKTVQPLTLNDLAIQDSIVLDKRTIAAAFDMPAFMVGIGEFNKAAYNNFISTRIMSIAIIIQQEYTRKLLYCEEQYFKLNPRSLMQYDLPELTAHVKELTAGGMLTRNEGRGVFDYSPSDKPEMDEFIALENYLPLEELQNQKKLKGGEKTETE